MNVHVLYVLEHKISKKKNSNIFLKNFFFHIFFHNFFQPFFLNIFT